MKHLKALTLICCMLFILNCKTTPPLQFQESKQDQTSLIVVGTKSSTINTENVDINEEQTAYINMNEKTFMNLLNANLDKLSLIEGIWSNEKNNYRIGIQETKEKGRYIAFILISQEPTMKKGEIIAEFFETKDVNHYSTEYYFEDTIKIITKGYVSDRGILIIFLKKLRKDNMAFIKKFPVPD